MNRVPPHDIPAEQALLGAVLWDNAQRQDIPASAFYQTRHKLAWDAMRRLIDQGQTVDIVTLTSQLRTDGTIEKAGGAAYISELTNNTTADHAEYYATIIADHAARRRAIVEAREIEAQAFAGASMDELAVAISAAAMAVTTRSDRIQTGTAVARDLVAELQRLYEMEEEPGFSTGFADLDKILRFHHGETTVIAGRPGMGKTAFALDCTRSALFSGLCVYWASLEMSSSKRMKRVLSSTSGIDGRKFRKASFSDHDWPKLTSALGKIAKTNLWIDDTPGQSSAHIASGVTKIAAENKVDLIVVDYVQKMREKGQGDRRQEIEYAMGRLVDLGKTVGAHVLVLAQLNRGVEKRNPPKPKLSDLKEAGRLEEDADNVLLLYREEYYKGEETPPDRKGLGEIIIDKCREGETGYVEVLWDGPTTSYRTLEKWRA